MQLHFAASDGGHPLGISTSERPLAKLGDAPAACTKRSKAVTSLHTRMSNGFDALKQSLQGAGPHQLGNVNARCSGSVTILGISPGGVRNECFRVLSNRSRKSCRTIYLDGATPTLLARPRNVDRAL